MRAKRRRYGRLDNMSYRKRRNNGFVSMQRPWIESYLGSHVKKTRGAYGKSTKQL
jgi:hypothetical protein